MSNTILPFPKSQPVSPVPLIDLVEQYQGLRDEIRSAVDRLFAQQAFILGQEVANFETEFASHCDSDFAIGCASGTDALILALMALDVGPGDEVITSPFTFFATASAITRLGAKPVFVDIDPVTYNLCPDAVEAAVTSKSRAIIPVHLFGHCADMQPLWRTAVRHSLAIVEDACQAIGAEYGGRKAGVLGTIGCFSFFPTKNLGGAGDGGMLTTDDPGLNARLKRLRVHGDAGRYEHVEVGLNSRLDALQAAVLRVKLRHLDNWTRARRHNAERYRVLFTEAGLHHEITLPEARSDSVHVYNQFVVRVTDGRRDQLLAGLKERQVGCAVYYPQPLHLQTCFQDLGYKLGDFPEAERASQEVVALPIYPELGEVRQERVVDAFQESLSASQVPQTIAFPQRRAAA